MDQARLAAAVDGLETLTPASPTTRYWLAIARQAQHAVDASSSMAFQHGRLQDAMRATISAFMVVGQGLDVCRPP